MLVPYCYLPFTTGSKFYSPDETANYAFTKNLAEHNNLKMAVDLNKEVNNLIFPRSVNVLNGFFVPMSFLGLPVFYGLLAKILGLKLITLMTPLLSLITVFILYLIVKEIFSKNIALLAALLLLINPAYWYLAGKSMLHNNLFLFWLLLGLLLLLTALKKRNVFIYLLAAVVFGASIWTRTSEIVWVSVFMLLFYIFNRKNVRWSDLLFFIIGFCGMLCLLFYVNYETYQNIFRSGYSSLESTNKISIFSITQQILFPFGVVFKRIFFHAWEFLFKYSWFIVLPAFWGGLMLLKNKLTSLQKAYLVGTLFTFVYLIIYYGSYWPWGEYGQPAEPVMTIGSPHLRYWLPILILLTPLAATFINVGLKVVYNLKSRVNQLVITALIIGLLAYSFITVFYDPQEGFVKIQKDIHDFQPRIVGVSEQVEDNAVLIVPDWADRIFFPEFLVIHSLGDKMIYAGDAYAELVKLLLLRPVYLYSADSDQDIASLDNKLMEYGLKLEIMGEIFKSEKLYKVIYVN